MMAGPNVDVLREGALLVFSGLPGTGKTTLCRLLAPALRAMHLRVDTIEQSLRRLGMGGEDLRDAGYQIAYRLAADNVRLGGTVLADSVNPLKNTRDAWLAVGRNAGGKVVEIEVTCSDAAEHRQRIEMRRSDIAGLHFPSWSEVRGRSYEPWDRTRLVVDTAAESAAESMHSLLERLVLAVPRIQIAPIS